MTAYMNRKIIHPFFIISLLFLVKGCSTVCFFKPESGAQEITTIRFHAYRFRRNEPIKDICTPKDGYNYCDGGRFTWIKKSIDFFCINCKPRCLVKKAKNDATIDDANFVVESPYNHAGETFCVSVTPYHCPTNEVPKGYIVIEK